MERRLIDANQVTPALTKTWCVLIQVVHRSKTKKKENGPTYRNYVLTDTKGTMVPLIMFGKAVHSFSHTLEPYKRYYVSNATVKETQAEYKHLEYPYTWQLYPRNLVEDYEEAVPPPFPCTFHFDKFAEFYRYADKEHVICIKALVLHTLPIQQTSTSAYRDCIVINEEMIPMILQVWNDVEFDTDVNVYAKYKCPTLILTNGLRVTTQQGLSLRTKVNAYILEEPPLLEPMPLKEWYNAHSMHIASLIQARAYRDPAKLFHPPRPSEILLLSLALTSIDNAKAVWTEGAITFIPGQQHIWFEACEQCLTPLDVDMDWKIKCPYCKEMTNVTARFDIGVFLHHNATVVEASIKSPEIDKFLPVTANEVRLAAAQNKPLTKEVESALQKQHIICFLKYYDHKIRGTVERRYPLLKLYTEAEMNEYHIAHQQLVLTQEALAPNTALQHIGSSSSTPKTPVEKQFFTPSMKTALSEAHKTGIAETTQPQEQIGAKRVLTFDQPQSTSTTALPAHKSTSLSPPHSAAATPLQQADDQEDSACTTPTKKLKGKEADR